MSTETHDKGGVTDADAASGGDVRDPEVLPHPDPVVIDWRDERPTYLEPGFVLGMLVAAVLAGVLIFLWGNSGNRAPAPTVAGAVTVPATDAPRAATIEDCPQPGSDVNIEAARTIRLFLAQAVGQKMAGLVVSPEVQAQLDATKPLPPVSRMTRVHGFNADASSVSSCVQSFWYEGDTVHTSTDVVVVQPGAKGWEVAHWMRNAPAALPRNDSVALPFFNGTGSCGNPDRIASVQLPAGNPSDRLHAAVEEMASGTAGRAMGATTALPADLQVVSAGVDGLTARVEVMPTTEKMNDCTGKAAVNQIKAVATTIARDSLPPDQTTTTQPGRRKNTAKAAAPAVDVQVVVNGQPVTSLRP